MGNENSAPQTRLVMIGPGFWNIRASFKKLAGLIDIGTHMSIIKLSNDKFLIIDTVPLDENLKKEIDELTENGKKIEAVVATHPFHSLAFPDFYKTYPNTLYYGTPRHVRNQTFIPWGGHVHDEEIRKKWEPDVQMRIPAGAEFIAPEPEAYNHFNSMWVYHPKSATIHVDDTVNYFQDPGLILKMVGKNKGKMEFHDSMKGPGLHPTPEAPLQFKSWVEDILKDWDFDNICCAHIGVKIGGAKKLLEETLSKNIPFFTELVEANKKKTPIKEEDTGEDCRKYNVEGNDCG